MKKERKINTLYVPKCFESLVDRTPIKKGQKRNVYYYERLFHFSANTCRQLTNIFILCKSWPKVTENSIKLGNDLKPFRSQYVYLCLTSRRMSKQMLKNSTKKSKIQLSLNKPIFILLNFVYLNSKETEFSIIFTSLDDYHSYCSFKTFRFQIQHFYTAFICLHKTFMKVSRK